MKIGTIDLGERPLFLAPMEDVTDIGFRKMCKRFGAAMVYTEFVSADAVIRSIKSTLSKLVIDDSERPVGIQIYGRDVASMVEAAKIVEQVKPDVIDINFGCPVKKVANKGAGSGMLKNIPLLLDITREVVKAVNTPVTVKTRLGWDNDNLIITDLAEQLQDCGIQALTIHGRTRAQMYTGEADWTLIGEVKNNPRIHIPIIGNGDVTRQALTIHGRTRAQMYTGEADWTLIGEVKNNPRIHIPIIGNGDVTSIEEAHEKFDRYGVDAVMIGRATFGCPWLFNQGEKQLTIDDKIDILEEMLRINVERIDEHRGILHTRRHLAASPIFKGIPDFKKTRIAMLRTTKMDELMAILEDCRERLRE